MANMIILAAESGAHGSEVNPWVIGGGTLLVLLVLLLAVLAIGGGREHS